jgi:5-methylcytosine-specific restriction endonuclease McrA
MSACSYREDVEFSAGVFLFSVSGVSLRRESDARLYDCALNLHGQQSRIQHAALTCQRPLNARQSQARTGRLVMLKRIGVAFAAVALLLPLQVMAQKGGRSSSHSSRSSSGTQSRRTSRPRTTSTRSRKSSIPNKSTVAKRDRNGRIKRSASARADFMRRTGYPKGRKDYVVDHIMPLECGGTDDPSNMQWQTVQGRGSKTAQNETAGGNKAMNGIIQRFAH